MSDANSLTRFTHTYDDLEPFEYKGQLFRKIPDGTFEWWICNEDKRWKAECDKSDRDSNYRKDREEQYEKDLMDFKDKLKSLPLWKRLFKRHDLEEPSEPCPSYGYERIPDEDYMEWMPVTNGPYYQPEGTKKND